MGQVSAELGKARRSVKIIGNIYFVGSGGLSSFLITSNDGHILIDGGLPHNAPMIAQSIETLGFHIKDVKILLNSHAHFDHSGGLAKLKEMSGARLFASDEDTPWLESGYYPGNQDLKYSAPPVKVDQTFNDGEVITLGDIALTAIITPGHSPGCTSWTTSVTDMDRRFDVLFFCSASVAGNRLIGPPQHEGIIDDYRYTFQVAKSWRPDVYLSNHPFFFDMKSKRQKQLAGDALAFIDRLGFSDHIARMERDFEIRLSEQKAEIMGTE